MLAGTSILKSIDVLRFAYLENYPVSLLTIVFVGPASRMGVRVEIYRRWCLRASI